VKTLYVAGPMTGIPEFNYPAFDAAERSLASCGYLVLNPTHAEKHNPTPGTPQAWGWYMRHCIRMVLAADGMALLPGWENSRGATLERTIATALDLDVRMLDAWLEAEAIR